VDAVGIAIISFFYFLTFIVGFIAHKQVKRHKDPDKQFLLASRKLPLLVGLGTLTATWVGGGYISGTAESVYSQGLLWTQAPWGYALSLILGGWFFAGIMRKRGYVSLLDPFQEKYGKKIGAFLYLPALTGDIFWSASILASLGYTVSTVLNLDFTVSVIVSAAVAVLYTFLGGLLAVAYTDVIQLIFICLGLGIIIPFALNNAGGLEHVMQSYWQLPFANDGQMWTWSDNAFLLILGGIPWGVYFQRILACPDVKTAQKLSFYAGIICFLFAIPSGLIGMIGAVVDWQALGVAAPTPALVLPYIFKYLTPYWVGMLGTAIIAAAVMSSVDSSILSASYMFVWNVVAPFRRKKMTNLTQWIQVAVIVVGALATVLALKVKSVYALWYLCSDLVYVLLFPQLVIVLYVSFANARGAVAGFLIAFFTRIAFGEPMLGISSFFDLPNVNFPFRTLSMLAGLISIPIFSLLLSEAEKENICPPAEGAPELS
jgi:high affinity choline transporter 7